MERWLPTGSNNEGEKGDGIEYVCHGDDGSGDDDDDDVVNFWRSTVNHRLLPALAK